MKISFHLYVKQKKNLLSCEKLCTKPRFYNEVHINSEMAYWEVTFFFPGLTDLRQCYQHDRYIEFIPVKGAVPASVQSHRT